MKGPHDLGGAGIRDVVGAEEAVDHNVQEEEDEDQKQRGAALAAVGFSFSLSKNGALWIFERRLIIN